MRILTILALSALLAMAAITTRASTSGAVDDGTAIVAVDDDVGSMLHQVALKADEQVTEEDLVMCTTALATQWPPGARQQGTLYMELRDTTSLIGAGEDIGQSCDATEEGNNRQRIGGEAATRVIIRLATTTEHRQQKRL